MCVLSFSLSGTAASRFDLDSIAQWGKFPKLCIDVYRWGDKFFNTYDSAYVVGSGYKFNVKMTADSWLDYYSFHLPDDNKVNLRSDPSTSVGAYLTYMAVSFGYDINLSNLFGSVKHARSRYKFGFNCSLLSFEVYWEDNDVGTRLRDFGTMKNLDVDFNGVHVDSRGIDVYYFFNHKKYSQAAAFAFSKIQKRSQGSLYAGFSYYSQNLDFDFGQLPSAMLERLPEWWVDHHFRVKTNNYGIRFGYGYNWVFARHWNMGVTASPTVSISRGFVNSMENTTNVSLFSRIKMSVAWNNGRWFAGLIGSVDSAIIVDRHTVFAGNNLSATALIGYRFNLW